MQNLREKRAKLAHDAQEITKKAAAETRAMTADETAQFERMISEVDSLKATIDAAEKAEAIARGLDAPVRVSEPAKPGKDTTLSLRQIALDPAWAGKAFEVHREERAVGKANVAGLLDVEVSSAFDQALKYFGPMWEVSEVFETATGNSLQYPTINDTANVAEQKAEGTAVTTTADPTFGSVVFGAYKYSSKAVLVGVETLEDSAIPLESIIGRLLAERIARQTNTDFTTKTDGPIGVATTQSGATAGVTGATNAITYGNLVDLVHSVDPWYRDGAAFMMNDVPLAYLRKLVDSNGLPLWQPSVQAGMPDKLLGYPVHLNTAMDNAVTTGKVNILFGQFRKYKIRRVGGIRMTVARELYAATHQIGFFGFIRCDGHLIDAGTKPIKYFVQA